MSPWVFKCYRDENGNDLMNDWYKKELTVQARARFDKILEHFRDLPNTSWGSNYFKQLRGYDGIYEIRFTVNNIVYRPLGCFDPFKGDFTFLIGAREQGDEFIPRKAPEIAEKRRDIIIKDPKRAYECSF